eukprot:jgi/Chrzof1/6295/Cz18g00160.t1
MMKTACVTGATGYVASELVKQLLERGYNVKATIRCPPDSPKVKHLVKLPERLPGKLQLHQVSDVQHPSPALDEAVAGCQYVFHVASPFKFDGNPQLDIVDPAVKGTTTVLRAAAQVKQPGQRVVVTSSVCAIHDQNATQVPGSGDKYSEADWNQVSTIDKEGYWVSKVESERVAWQLATELGLDLVTILPNFVLGPVFADNMMSISIGFMKEFLEAPGGKVPSGNWTGEDVRDVAVAHILAAETPTATGRYIISQPFSISARFITGLIKEKYPEAAAVLPDGDDAPIKHMIDISKVQKDLGLELTPVEDTLLDMADSLLTLGIAQPSWYHNRASLG